MLCASTGYIYNPFFLSLHMLLLRIILFPFSIIYGLIIILRNLLYQSGVFNSTSFDIPIICIGNLSFGGTGKTPHIEYIIRLLQDQYKIAVLSRGYRRKTKGYVFAGEKTDASQIGDEPFQIKNKFSDVAVGVCANRVLGVPDLLGDAPETDVILMDDGFQHRAIKAGLNILLTDFSRLFTRDFIAPSGTLREFRSAYKRAQIIIVTKCPYPISASDQQHIISEIAPLPAQKVFFTYQSYDEPVSLYNEQCAAEKNADVLLFAGIANTYSLEDHLKKTFRSVTTLKFADHKDYTEIVLEDILKKFQEIKSENKIIMTTEKDAVKLRKPEFESILAGIPVFYQPLKIAFPETYHQDFNKLIFEYVAHTDQ